MTIELIKPFDLYVDVNVQRELHTGNVNKLQKNWDPDKVGVLLGSRRVDGKVYLLDGQSRSSAAKISDPDEPLRVDVREGLSRAEEAALFIAFNDDRKKVAVHELFRVRAIASEQPYRDAWDVLEKHNLGLKVSASTNNLACAGTLGVFLTKHGEVSDFELAIEIAEASWGRSKETWLTVPFMGLCYVIAKNRNLDVERMVLKLRDRTPMYWQTTTEDQLRKMGMSRSDGGRGTAKVCAMIFAAEYNKNLKRNRLDAS